MAQQPASQKADHELLTEHFGYPPVSLLDDIINTVNILAESALKSIEQFLSSSSPKALGFRDSKKSSSSAAAASNGTAPPPRTAQESAKFEIDNGTHQLETLLCSSIDRNFDIFELYVMKHLLRVAPEDRAWIKLKHYDGLDFGRAAAAAASAAASGSEDTSTAGPTATSVNALRRKLRASQRLNAMLQAEKAKNDALLRQLRAVVGGGTADVKDDPDPKPAPLAFLRDMGSLTDGDAQAPIQTTTAFALSQLQALRALSTSLKNMAPDLAAAADAAAAGDEAEGSSRNKTWRKERVEYVEGLTRKHLENVRGLELGSQGEVRDGEWQGEGRKISRAEVEALERVTGILSGHTLYEDRMDES
ncbi:hypothetical protein jhhlp_001920 [Lomentospora prolificans]|uniref:Kinetochore-associated protein MTW1 n=1 Tax=Lomentospora prolificans TaxID=41688 RepID=A0A2N3NCK7_9PEZI|nr:hypothetical protein jhhlp_001920 [Lomentospora prolificans]